MRSALPDPSVQRSIDLDLARIEFYDEQLARLEWYLKRTGRSEACETRVNPLWGANSKKIHTEHGGKIFYRRQVLKF